MEVITQSHILSKSTFMLGDQCEKALFLSKFQGHLANQEESKPQLEHGAIVGRVARQLFPGGFDASPATPFDYQQSVELTQELIGKGYSVIYEAAFQFNGVLAAVDILVKSGDGWKAFEVKGSTTVSDTHKQDVALQYYVIKGAGVCLEDISIITINNEYTKIGDLELDILFKQESVLQAAIDKSFEIDLKVEQLKKVLIEGKEPKTKIGTHCDNPYPCAFKKHCWKAIPEVSIFNISRLSAKKKFELYDKGIINLEDITPDHKLTDNQQIQVTSFVQKKDSINHNGINEFLSSLSYPLYFMDFETISPPVPLFDKSRPFMPIPFQYSLHFKTAPDGKLTHSEFLADATGDPREEFIKKLIFDTEAPGDILTYNEEFEKSRLKELAFYFPQYAEQLNKIIVRVKDLMLPFSKKYYYKWSFMGLYSIKRVLPALLPDLSYKLLAINNGMDASLTFERLLGQPENFTQEVRKNLIDYCTLDTYAMAKILEHLENITEYSEKEHHELQLRMEQGV